MRTPNIVVGTDGSDASRAAVRWAAREAERRGVPLRIVHAFDWEWHAARYNIGGEFLEIARQQADALTQATADEAGAVAPGVPIETDALMGNPVPRLLDIAAEADLLVVGNRGRGGFTSLLLGSVSQRLALHAPSPVVVVRGHGEAGPVAAGVDGRGVPRLHRDATAAPRGLPGPDRPDADGRRNLAHPSSTEEES